MVRHLSSHLWIVLGLFFYQWILVSAMVLPTIFADELIFLGHARYLSGVAHMPDLFQTGFGQVGYSLFLLPAFLLSSDPFTQYAGVLCINVLLRVSMYIGLFLLLRNLLEIKRIPSQLASLVVCLYPGYTAIMAVAMSENLSVPLFVWSLVAVGYLLRNSSWWLCVAVSILLSLQPAVHLRAFMLLPLLFVLCALFVFLKKISVWQAVCMVGIAVLSTMLFSHIHNILLLEGWQTDTSPYAYSGKNVASVTSGIASSLTVSDAWTWFLTSLSHILYLIQSSLGLVLVGFSVVSVSLYSGWKQERWKAVHNDRWMLFALLTLFSLSVLLVTSRSHWVLTRFDMLLYGRHIETILAPWLALSLATIFSKDVSRSVLTKGTLVITVLTAILFAFRFQDILSFTNVSGFNILGVYSLYSVLGGWMLQHTTTMTSALAWTIAITSCLCIAALVLSRYVGRTTIGIVTVLFLWSGLSIHNTFLLPRQEREQYRVMHVVQSLPEDTEHIAYDWEFYDKTYWLYQYLLPHVTFSRFSSTEDQVQPEGYMLSSVNYGFARGAERLTSLEDVQDGNRLSLWYMPPSSP